MIPTQALNFASSNLFLAFKVEEFQASPDITGGFPFLVKLTKLQKILCLVVCCCLNGNVAVAVVFYFAFLKHFVRLVFRVGVQCRGVDA